MKAAEVYGKKKLSKDKQLLCVKNFVETTDCRRMDIFSHQSFIPINLGRFLGKQISRFDVERFYPELMFSKVSLKLASAGLLAD